MGEVMYCFYVVVVEVESVDVVSKLSIQVERRKSRCIGCLSFIPTPKLVVQSRRRQKQEAGSSQAQKLMT
jgi:hypothetical protein